MKKPISYLQSVENAYRKIHLSHLILYSILLFSCLAVYLTLNESRVQAQEIQRVRQVISNNIDDIVEEAYISEVLGYEKHGNMALDKVQQFLREQNYGVNLSFGKCNGDADSLYRLQIGSRELKNCIVIESEKRLISSSSIVSFALVFFAFLLTLLFYGFVSKKLRARIIEPLFERIEEAERDRIYKIISKQVAHDIQSPVAALKFIFNSPNINKEEKELYYHSIERIESILGDLSVKTKIKNKLLKSTKSGTGNAFSRQLRFLINEKASEHFPVVIKSKIAELGSSALPVDTSKLIRVISNLINNSVEAGASEILLNVDNNSKGLLFEITDNGQGFPEELLDPEISSSYKPSAKGNGLGIYSAKEVVNSANGKMDLANTDRGAKVLFTVPSLVAGVERKDINA